MHIEIDPACVEFEVLEDFGHIVSYQTVYRDYRFGLVGASGRRQSRQFPVYCPGDCRLSADRTWSRRHVRP
jgi:hypothetical protein